MDDMYVPQAHFVQHKRFDDTLINPDHMVKRRVDRPNTAQTKDIQPVVGDAPKHELLQQSDQTQQQLNNYKSYKSKCIRCHLLYCNKKTLENTAINLTI